MIYFKCDRCGKVDDFVLGNCNIVELDNRGKTISLCNECYVDFNKWFLNSRFVYNNSYYDRAGDDEEAKED